MKITKILCIEDSTEKYMDIYCLLKKMGFVDVKRVINAEKAFEEISKDNSYSLIISDMCFDYYGEMIPNAGEKTMELFQTRGFYIPFIFCSSQNWKIPGSLGFIFYCPKKDWETEAEELIRQIQMM